MELPWELTEFLKSLRGDLKQRHRPDPADLRTLEALESFEYQGKLLLGRNDPAAEGGLGDTVQAPSHEVPALLKTGKWALVSGGPVTRLIFDAWPHLGYDPWQDYNDYSTGLSEPQFDAVFIPTRLNGNLHFGAFVIEKGALCWMRFGWCRRLTYDHKHAGREFPGKFHILDTEEIAALCAR